MLCPACKNVTLTMADRQGVEIDYCPQCRGVWLDRGELDKIIDRAAELEAAPARQAPAGRDPRPAERRDYDDDHRREGKYYRKRKGLLGELFDFD
jgi:Zn-finger nucleic acid-binding protein